MNPSRFNKRSSSKKPQQEELTLLREIKDQLVTRNIKDSHSLRESVHDVTRNSLKRNKTYTFIRKYRIGAVSASSVTGAAAGYAFNLATVPNASEFTTLFDQYRIKQVTVTFLPNYIQANVPLYTALDYDDALTPPTLLSVFEKDTCRISEANQVVERTFNPRALREVYATPVTSGYETAVSPWLDTQNDTVPHYGLKYFIAQLPASGLTNTYEVNVELMIQCRSPT